MLDAETREMLKNRWLGRLKEDVEIIVSWKINKLSWLLTVAIGVDLPTALGCL